MTSPPWPRPQPAWPVAVEHPISRLMAPQRLPVVAGVDVEADRIKKARSGRAGTSPSTGSPEALAVDDASFDGVFLKRGARARREQAPSPSRRCSACCLGGAGRGPRSGESVVGNRQRSKIPRWRRTGDSTSSATTLGPDRRNGGLANSTSAQRKRLQYPRPVGTKVDTGTNWGRPDFSAASPPMPGMPDASVVASYLEVDVDYVRVWQRI